VALPTPSAAVIDSIAQVHQAYEGLVCSSADGAEHGLGGQLLYAGELDTQGRAFTIAANIAGAATIASSSEAAALRRALREGAIDFLVNSLDEALRILKNEIRKRQPVAVAISLASAVIEAEMIERGVRPDLLPPQSTSLAASIFLSQGVRHIQDPPQSAQKLLIWPAPEEYAQNLAGFEALLAGQLASDDQFNRRWLRLSTRYLGPAARRLRSVACDEPTALKLIAQFGPPLNAIR
jgi:hypothetical protein